MHQRLYSKCILAIQEKGKKGVYGLRERLRNSLESYCRKNGRDEWFSPTQKARSSPKSVNIFGTHFHAGDCALEVGFSVWDSQYTWAAPFTEIETQAMKLVADDCWGVCVSDEFHSVHAELKC